MGQGFYTAIVFGVIGPDAEKLIDSLGEGDLAIDDLWTSLGSGGSGGKLFRGRYPGQLKITYESKVQWCGFIVADSDGNINTGYDPNLEDRFPLLGGIFNYRSCRLSEIENLLEEIAPGRIAECRAMWSEFQSELKTLGVDIPEGDLLFINDYD